MSETPQNRLLKQYQRFVEISQNLASTLDLETLLRKIMDVAVELVEAEEASILLYDQHTRRLYFETATNAESSPVLQKLFVPEESIAGWVALNRKPQIVNNVYQDERHFENVDQQTNFVTRSMVAVPLAAKSKLIGVLEVLNKRSGVFNEEDQEILLALAAQAAVAIENSRLFQQSDLVSEFIHELRTPLSSIITASHLLQRPELGLEQRAQFAQTIQKEAQRLSELSSVFLHLSSLESGRAELRLTTFPARALLDECRQFLSAQAAEKNLSLRLETEEPLPNLQADRDKLKQVLINLLTNAVKYNRPGGIVWLRASADSDRLKISVQDTGVGIPADQISQLFTRFFRARNVEQSIPGTGLGLSITRRIVELHGGTITVESQLDHGTTFAILLPTQQ